MKDENFGLRLGKDWATSACAQGMDMPSLGSMCVLERLNDPIETPMKSHVIQFKEMHKPRVRQRGWGMSIRDNMMVHDRMGSMGMLVCEGVHQFIWERGSTKGCDTLKNVRVCEGESWSPYNEQKAHEIEEHIASSQFELERERFATQAKVR
jgi:hypothetical protein